MSGVPAATHFLAGVVIDGTSEHVEPVELAGEHLGEGVLDLRDILGGQVSDTRLRLSRRP